MSNLDRIKTLMYGKQYLNENLNINNPTLSESKATEAQALSILNNKNDDNPEETLNSLKQIDDSKNQVNLPAMSFIIDKNVNTNDLKSVFNEYNQLKEKNRIKPIQVTKNGVIIGDKTFNDFLKFAEYIHGETNKYVKPSNKSSVTNDFEAEDKPIWSGNNIDIYDGTDVGRCIKYSQGSLTGKSYSFCIGQPGNTMYQSYRDTKDSSFYFIIDRNKFVLDDKGNVDLSNPLHIVVFDNTKYGVELTDANNTTGTIDEFGDDSDSYISYLESKGVPVDKLINKVKTSEEEKEQKLLGKRNADLEWFVNLPYEYKSKYIGRGYPLTDAQFDYLIS